MKNTERPVTALMQTHPPARRSGPRILHASVCLVAILAVAAIRWWMRLEPMNSDDLALFEYASDAVTGQHWLFTPDPRPALGPDLLCLSCRDGGLSHQSLRIGMLPVAMPIIWLFGRSATSYHLVPLLFALVGVAAVWLLARKNIGAGAALAIVGLHAIMPYELMHAGRFFADLPAAACLLLAIAVLDGQRTGASPRLRGVGVGALLFWAYLLRANSPLLLAPGLGLLFLRKPDHRPLLFTAGIVLVAGWLGEQLLYVSKGFEFGYRAMIVSRAIETYTPHLTLYSPLEFFGREASFFWKDLRGWPHGALACSFVFLGLASQSWIAFTSRNETFRLVATMGITTWVVFTYGFLEWTEDGIRAPIPSYRYLQPFFYASILCIPFAGARLLGRLRQRAPGLRPLLSAVVAVGVSAVAALWLAGDRRFPQRLDGPDRDIRRTLDAIDRAAGGDPIELWSTCLQGRVISLFTAPPVTPRCAPLEELVPVVASRAAAAVLRDTTRELTAHRYRPPDRREAALAASSELDRALWSGYSPFHIARRSVLFTPGDEEPRPGIPLALEDVEVLPPEAALRRDAAGVTVNPLATTYVLAAAIDSTAPEIAPCRGCRYTLRIEVDSGEAVRGDLVVRQYDGRQGLGEARQMLRAGENYMSWQAVPGADRYRVGVRLRAAPAAGNARAVVRRIEVKRFETPDRKR